MTLTLASAADLLVNTHFGIVSVGYSGEVTNYRVVMRFAPNYRWMRTGIAGRVSGLDGWDELLCAAHVRAQEMVLCPRN